MPSLWTILCYLFFPPKFIYRIKRIRWLFKSLGKVLQGCEEDPLPRDLLARGLWYAKRLYGMYLLYRLMVDSYDVRKKERGGKGVLLRIKKTNRIE